MRAFLYGLVSVVTLGLNSSLSLAQDPGIPDEMWLGWDQALASYLEQSEQSQQHIDFAFLEFLFEDEAVCDEVYEFTEVGMAHVTLLSLADCVNGVMFTANTMLSTLTFAALNPDEQQFVQQTQPLPPVENPVQGWPDDPIQGWPQDPVQGWPTTTPLPPVQGWPTNTPPPVIGPPLTGQVPIPINIVPGNGSCLTDLSVTRWDNEIARQKAGLDAALQNWQQAALLGSPLLMISAQRSINARMLDLARAYAQRERAYFDCLRRRIQAQLQLP